mmetsp:Transcript_3248/g.9920  ORF Transcript_3248/g.9920 Transcript_3248/m.9920 type:complete len:268 (+) Transcript_3248:212-1015(+)
MGGGHRAQRRPSLLRLVGGLPQDRRGEVDGALQGVPVGVGSDLQNFEHRLLDPLHVCRPGPVALAHLDVAREDRLPSVIGRWSKGLGVQDPRGHEAMAEQAQGEAALRQLEDVEVLKGNPRFRSALLEDPIQSRLEQTFGGGVQALAEDPQPEVRRRLVYAPLDPLQEDLLLPSQVVGCELAGCQPALLPPRVAGQVEPLAEPIRRTEEHVAVRLNSRARVNLGQQLHDGHAHGRQGVVVVKDLCGAPSQVDVQQHQCLEITPVGQL